MNSTGFLLSCFNCKIVFHKEERERKKNDSICDFVASRANQIAHTAIFLQWKSVVVSFSGWLRMFFFVVSSVCSTATKCRMQ